MAKAQHLTCVPFPRSYDVGETTVNGVYLPAPLEWARVFVPIPLYGKPGHHLMSVRLHAFVSESDTVLVQVATRRAPFNPHALITDPNVMVLTGDADNDIDIYSQSDLFKSTSDFDLAELFVKGQVTADGSTQSPNESTDAGYNAGQISANELIVSDADWTRLVLQEGAALVFYDVNDQVVATRAVSGVGLRHTTNLYGSLTWTTPLSEDQLGRINQAAEDGGLWWVLVRQPTFGLVCFTAWAQARTE